MPNTGQSPKPRKNVWVGVGVIALVAIAGVGYLWFKPAPPAQPVVSSVPATPPPAAAPDAVPFTKKHIYNETGNPKADIAAALVKAKKEHKRVILDFGGDWCGDCQVLDIYFHQPPNDALLARNFILVHVWVGHIDTNLDIMKKYGVSSQKGGVPGLAVLAPDGSVVVAQQAGEFDRMRQMESSSVTEFLNKWKS